MEPTQRCAMSRWGYSTEAFRKKPLEYYEEVVDRRIPADAYPFSHVRFEHVADGSSFMTESVPFDPDCTVGKYLALLSPLAPVFPPSGAVPSVFSEERASMAVQVSSLLHDLLSGTWVEDPTPHQARNISYVRRALDRAFVCTTFFDGTGATLAPADIYASTADIQNQILLGMKNYDNHIVSEIAVRKSGMLALIAGVKRAIGTVASICTTMNYNTYERAALLRLLQALHAIYTSKAELGFYNFLSEDNREPEEDKWFWDNDHTGYNTPASAYDSDAECGDVMRMVTEGAPVMDRVKRDWSDVEFDDDDYEYYENWF